ncbi:MAG: hypothetical protein AAGA75_09270 [Cyanobacteria bacterium P01_E01_bin.6]
MPASRGRYQSRILSFLSQQSMQWRDRTLKTVREARFSLSWGMQIVLYPIYLLFQSGRLVGQQLRAASRRFAPLLEAVKDDDFDPTIGVPPLNVDTPFHEVLECLELLHLPITISSSVLQSRELAPSTTQRQLAGTPSSRVGGAAAIPSQSTLAAQLSADKMAIAAARQENGLSSLPTIRGFASLIESQALVLTDTHNKVIDILTPEQQQWMYRHIAFEVASFYRSQNLIKTAQAAGQLTHHQQRSPNELVSRGAWRFLPLPQDKQTMVGPVRFFRALMGWMQTSPIAVSANVFQESALVHLGYPQTLPLPQSPQLQNLSQSIQALADALLGSSSSPQFPNDGRDRPHVNRWFDPDHYSSVDGWSGSNQLNHQRRDTEQFLQTPSLPFRSRWVSNWDEQIRGSDSLADSPIHPAFIPGHPENGQVESEIEGDQSAREGAIDRQQAIKNRHRSPLNGAASDLANSTSATHSSIASSKRHASSDPDDLDPDDLTVFAFGKEPGAIAPTVLDAKVTTVGYEKHPLERLLEWIDETMLWMEENTSKVLKWLQALLKLSNEKP